VNPAAAVWLGLGISIAAQNCNSLNVVSSIKNQDLQISAITGVPLVSLCSTCQREKV